jgi:hypothetical protein
MGVDREDRSRDDGEVRLCVVQFCAEGVVAVITIFLEEVGCCWRQGLLAVRAVVASGRVRFWVGGLQVCLAGFDVLAPVKNSAI